MIMRKRQVIHKIKNPMKKIDKIVRGVCIYWCLFVTVAWVTYWFKDSVPDTLIQFGLGGGAVELMITGVLEIARDKLNKKGELEDEMD